MNYHLNQNGQDVGVFPLEELRRRRQTGELTGSEQIWCEGMNQWQPLDSVLQSAPRPATPKFIAPPPLPPGHKKKGANPAVVAVLVIAGVIFISFVVWLGVMGYKIARIMPTLRQQVASQGHSRSSAMQAASRPVTGDAKTRTWQDVQKTSRDFRVRQYLEGYQLRGERNPECDFLAQQFLTNWIAYNYGGTMDTNLPSLPEISNRLANDPACQDPLLLAIVAVNTTGTREATRRLERAVKGFENSKHLGYPKFFAAVELAAKPIQDRVSASSALDAQALQYLKAALSDGSIEPGDQSELAEILVNDWGRSFFDRNALAVCSVARERGGDYEWLALTLEGEHEISEAWRARGGGWQDTVSEAGWKGFYDHLATARKSLTRAWKLHPEFPLAPCRMIYVSLGDSDIAEMRQWFDRTTSAQLDYARAWNEMRWGLRPRWNGDYDSMLAFGVTALHTRRFDTDVPRMFFDSVSDLESEMNMQGGQRLFGRDDIWPHMQELYEGYIAEPSVTPYVRNGWRNSYTAVAYLAGKYDVARKQLDALDWQPRESSLSGWNRDLSFLPQEVAARTSPQSAQINDAEQWRDGGNLKEALLIYKNLAAFTNLDARTSLFVQDRLATLAVEQRLQDREWVDFLPTDTNFTGWYVGHGKFKPQPDGALEVQSDKYGHLIYSRVRMGTEFEVRGQFELVSSSTGTYQAGLVMGVPQYESYDWYAFRIKQNREEHNVACFSQNWTTRQIVAPLLQAGRAHAFDFRFQNGRVTASVDGSQVFNNAAPPRDAYVSTNEFFLGLGAYNDANVTVVRYRQIQARKLFRENNQ